MLERFWDFIAKACEKRVVLRKTDYDQAIKNILAAEQMAFKLNRELMAERLMKNGAYNERNMVVVGLAKLALHLNYKAGIGKHEPAGAPDWDPEWLNVVYVDLPSGQVSWHVHDDEMYLFDFLPPYEGKWDGHSTSLKYNRVMNPRG